MFTDFNFLNMNINKILNLNKINLIPLLSRHFHYKQGQIYKNTREYFYYIDHNGQVRITKC